MASPKVRLDLDVSVIDLLKVALDTHISRVESQASRTVVPSVRDAIKAHVDELRICKIRFAEAVSGQKPMV